MRVEVIYPKGSIGSEEDAAQGKNFRTEVTHIWLDATEPEVLNTIGLFAILEEVWDRLSMCGTDDECRETHVLDVMGERCIASGDIIILHTKEGPKTFVCRGGMFVAGEFI